MAARTAPPAGTSLTAPAHPLTADVAEEVRRLAADARAADGIEALGEQTLLALADVHAAVRHLLVRDGTGSLVGYAQVDLGGSPPSAELVVAPDARRGGLGSTLLSAVHDATAPAAGPPSVWAHGDLPPARALAARAGLRAGRELLQLARDLPAGTAAPEPPPGVSLRTFVVGRDEEAVLAVNRRAFADHPEQGRLSRTDLEARMGEPWFDPEDLVLAERDGTLVAFLWLKVEPGSAEGELYVLGVDPSAQGQGLGRLLTGVTLDRLGRKGLHRVLLYTEAANAAAVRTYTAAGFTRSRVDVQYVWPPAQG